jgi:hypothetical protein
VTSWSICTTFGNDIVHRAQSTSVCVPVPLQGSVTLRALWPDVIAMLRQGVLAEGGRASLGPICYHRGRAWRATSAESSSGGSCLVYNVTMEADTEVRIDILTPSFGLPCIQPTCT